VILKKIMSVVGAICLTGACGLFTYGLCGYDSATPFFMALLAGFVGAALLLSPVLEPLQSSKIIAYQEGYKEGSRGRLAVMPPKNPYAVGIEYTQERFDWSNGWHAGYLDTINAEQR
jgi:ribosome modulation factor